MLVRHVLRMMCVSYDDRTKGEGNCLRARRHNAHVLIALPCIAPAQWLTILRRGMFQQWSWCLGHPLTHRRRSTICRHCTESALAECSMSPLVVFAAIPSTSAPMEQKVFSSSGTHTANNLLSGHHCFNQKRSVPPDPPGQPRVLCCLQSP